MNEVRALASSLLENGGRLEVPKGWKWTPGSTVLGLAAEDEIVVDEAGFTTLARAHLTAIEAAYGE